MNSNQVTKTVTKLNEMLKGHFGVVVEYFPVTSEGPVLLNAQNTLATRALETAKRNAGAPMIVAHNQMIIPMRVDGSLVGAASVHKINKLQPRQLTQIKDTVDLILAEVLIAAKKLDHLQSVEEYFTKETSNVISISGHLAAVAMRS
jgi:hypothetical protein